MQRLGLLLLAGVFPLVAGVVRVEVSSDRDVLGGRSFGLVGAYHKVVGKAYFAVDPADPANEIITDVELAPRNADGKVEFQADFYLIKPKNADRGNGTVLLEINNRGGKGMLAMFNRASGSRDPEAEAHFGDNWLLEQGYSLLWVGWQFDVPHRADSMRLYTPSAGKGVRGLARADFVVTDREYDHSLADRSHVPYEVADPAAAENVLTVRERVESERRVIPRAKWKFARMEHGEPVEDRGRVWLEEGFEPNKIYEVVYVAEDPPLVGLGPAAVRDFVSFLKRKSSSQIGFGPDDFDRAIGFGISQSGRFLRTFLYYGFNLDESGERVFDGVMSHVAGGGRGSFNHRFAQPSRDAHPFMNFLYPTDIFPFTDVPQTDPMTGWSGGISDRYEGEVRPKIFYTNSSYEYWGRAASLIHTTIDGKRDVEVPEHVRIYHFAGTQHGPASFPPRRTIGEQRSNPMNFRWGMRALLARMNAWIGDDREPPESRYGRVADRTLVDAGELGFPKIPGVGYSTRVHKAYRADYGPRFYSDGIVEKEPPEVRGEYPVRVPAIDQDGNETVGIRLPEQRVPLATYSGWNLFNAKSGPVDEISSMQGSYIPFARTKAAREKSGDPRASIEERYPTRGDYLGRVAEAALELAEQGYLLESDVASVIGEARRHWDHLHGE